MGRSWLAAAGIAVALTPSRVAVATVVDPSFVETPFASVASVVTAMAWAPDGSNRLFVLRKTGGVYVIQDGVVQASPFATISPLYRVSECGLLGIAFDPDFTRNHYVYLFVTVSAVEQQIIRYTANGNIGEDKTVLVGGLPTAGRNHDGGALAFGPDGKLYWAIGDNGSRIGAGGDLLSLASKVGRANRDGSVPTDNPFYDGEGANNDYIWARGFRNPFSMTFQPTSGRLWLNVVGTLYEQVFTPQAGDNGGWSSYESNQPAGYLPPVISYKTNKVDELSVAAGAATRTAGLVTLTTGVAHKLRPGAKVTLAGMSDASFDGEAFVVSVLGVKQITFLQAGADAVGGSGTLSSQAIGGAITGGAFWSSNAVPAPNRDSFFFGDYNSGKLLRATLSAEGQVTSVSEWATDIPEIVDVALGPDGNLYYVGTGGNIVQVSYVAPALAMVVSPTELRLAEGGRAAFSVRLSKAPPGQGTRKVTVALASGDADVSVAEGATLAFSATNWSVPQGVVLAATADADSLEDTAIVQVSSAGLKAQSVVVSVTDSESSSIVVSPSQLELTEGQSASLSISLSQPPREPLQLNVMRKSGDESVVVDSSGTTIAFDASNWSSPQLVTLSALQDSDATDGSAVLEVSGPELPSRRVEIVVRDDDPSAPVITSTPVMTAVVGAAYAYDVDAQGLPTPSYALPEAPSAMSIDAQTGLISWTPSTPGSARVVVQAANGVSPNALQAFAVEALADQPPSCSLTAPQPGAVLRGADEEFFGDVTDDVGAVRAEFVVDGVLLYADADGAGHFHAGGSHNLFDTTQFDDGEHVLSFVGYDTSGQSCVTELTVSIENIVVAPEPRANAGEAGQGGRPNEEPGAALAGGSGDFGMDSAGGAAGQSSPSVAGAGGDDSAQTEPGAAGGGCECAASPRGQSKSVGWLLGALVLARSRRRRGARGSARVSLLAGQ